MSKSEEPSCGTGGADGAGACGTGGLDGAGVNGRGGADGASCSCDGSICAMKDAYSASGSSNDLSGVCSTGGVAGVSGAFRTLHFGPGSAHSFTPLPTLIRSKYDLDDPNGPDDSNGPVGLGGLNSPEYLADADADVDIVSKPKDKSKKQKRVSNFANRIRTFLGAPPRFEPSQYADPHKANRDEFDYIYDYSHDLTDKFFDIKEDARKPSAVDESLVPGDALQGRKEIVAGEVAGGVQSAMAGASPLNRPAWALGQLDAKTLAALNAERNWYTLQSRRLSPPKPIPIPPPTPLPAVLAKLTRSNKGRLRSLFKKEEIIQPFKERHSKVLWSAAWRGPEPGGWACGCPGLPCICYRQPLPPRPIPRADEMITSSVVTDRSLGLAVSHRLRKEYALHRQLRALPPPPPGYLDELRAPLFCLGLGQCFARREMRGKLMQAAERTRAAALANKIRRRGSRGPPPPPPGTYPPCGATCQRVCGIK